MALIRAAALKDIPSLQTLFLQLGYQTDPENLKRHINDAKTDYNVLVAEAEQDVCGVIVVNFITPVHESGLWALLSALVINESARGQALVRNSFSPLSNTPLIKAVRRLSFQAVKAESGRTIFMKIMAIRRSESASSSASPIPPSERLRAKRAVDGVHGSRHE